MFNANTAAEICRHLPPDVNEQALLRDSHSPRQFLDALVAAGKLTSAVHFLAAALPKREAVWWGCVCTRLGLGKPPIGPAAAALAAAEKWTTDPTDANRRAARSAAEAADLGTPAGAVAMAVFFSDGSIAPPDLPAVPPGEQLTATCVAAGIQLAAVLTQPEKAFEKFRRFVALGLEVESGANRWKGKA